VIVRTVLEELLHLVESGPPASVILGQGIAWVDVVNHVIVPETIIMLLEEDFPGISREDAIELFFKSRTYGLAAFGELQDKVVQEQMTEIAEGMSM
jgi:hypothetical protein